MKLGYFRQIFERSSYTKFPENPTRRSRVVPWGRTDMTRLIVALHSFTNAPKYGTQILWQLVYIFSIINNRHNVQSCYFMRKFPRLVFFLPFLCFINFMNSGRWASCLSCPQILRERVISLITF